MFLGLFGSLFRNPGTANEKALDCDCVIVLCVGMATPKGQKAELFSSCRGRKIQILLVVLNVLGEEELLEQMSLRDF